MSNSSLNQSRTTDANLNSLLSRHQQLMVEVGKENWMSADPTSYGVNARGESLYDFQRREVTGIFSRTFEGTLYLPPNHQKGLTQVAITQRVDELVVEKSYAKLFTSLLVDLQQYQERTGKIVTAEQLMESMGISPIPRLCDLELAKQGVERHIADSKSRPEVFYGGPEAHALGYAVKKLGISLCQNQADREIRPADLSVSEFHRLTGPVVTGSPDQLN